MTIKLIHPKKSISRMRHRKYMHPYLLRNLEIVRPNQVWEINIIYIPMKSDFMYLTAIMDGYSRFIVAWQLSDTLEKENQTDLLYVAIARYGKPEMIHANQSSHYTYSHWVETLEELGIQIRMNGKGLATDNMDIESWFQTLKQKHINLNPVNSDLEPYRGIDRFIQKYNKRRQLGMERQKPWICTLKRKLQL